MESRNCKICGKQFFKKPSISKKSWEKYHRYCSKKCGYAAQIRRALMAFDTTGYTAGSAWHAVAYSLQA